MDLARVLTQFSSANNSNSGDATLDASFSDAIATRASFLQPVAVSSTHTKRSRQRKALHAIDASESTGGDSDEDEPPRVTSQRRRQRDRKKQQQYLAAHATNENDDDIPARVEAKRERTRQLQNLRQRRYRARKKCSLSELQQRSQQLSDANTQLERAVRSLLALP